MEVLTCSHGKGRKGEKCKGDQAIIECDAYTTKRSYGEALACARMVAQYANDHGTHGYLITHTMPASFCDMCRRFHFRRFLDLFRKEHGLFAYIWTTEVHSGGGECDGLVHHHLYATFVCRWRYQKKIVQWSKRFTFAPNGLDVKKSASPYYCIKYMSKDLQRFNSAPFRWWGCSQLPRTFNAPQPGIPTQTIGQSRVVVVPGEVAAELCAKVNADWYICRWAFRQHRIIERKRFRRMKRKAVTGNFDPPG